MTALDECLRQIQACEAQQDWLGMRHVRVTLLQEHPDSEAASEALYRLGLDDLFRLRDFDGAMAHFEEASKRKHLHWSAAARTSLALCYVHAKRTQKAMFELRKVAFVKEPSMHSVTALALMENLLAQELGNGEEIGRVRKERLGQLNHVVAQTAPGQAQGQYLLQLGLLYLDMGERNKGRATLEQARALGERLLGAETYKSVADALSK